MHVDVALFATNVLLTYGSDWHSNGLQHVGIAIRITDTLQNKTLCFANFSFETQQKGSPSFKHVHNIRSNRNRKDVETYLRPDLYQQRYFAVIFRRNRRIASVDTEAIT